MECDVSDSDGVGASVLGWPTCGLGGDIHRPVVSH